MENKVHLQIIYSPEIKLTISQKTLKEAVSIFMDDTLFGKYIPEKVVVVNKNLTLLFDREKFIDFLNDKISESQLFKELDMMFYYRNINDLLTDDGQDIDAGSLWRRFGQILVLVDEDNYVECDWNSKLFEKA